MSGAESLTRRSVIGGAGALGMRAALPVRAATDPERVLAFNGILYATAERFQAP